MTLPDFESKDSCALTHFFFFVSMRKLFVDAFTSDACKRDFVGLAVSGLLGPICVVDTAAE